MTTSTLRVIVDLEGSPAEWNMAVDEALLRLRSENLIPDTLRVYVINPPAVTIGRFQMVSSSVNLAVAERMGVSVVRRVSGGGSVYHDPYGEVTYSIVVGFESKPQLRGIAESFRILCTAVAEALRMLGVSAEYKPVNDVVIGGRKVSGNAQARTAKAVLQHGTILYNVNREAIRRLLKAPKEKLEAHGVEDISERVVGLNEVLARPVKPVEIAIALVEAFRKTLGYDRISIGRLQAVELEAARELVAKRYTRREWLFKK